MRNWRNMLRRGAVLLGLLGALLFGAAALWYFNRPLPAPVSAQVLFDGITYTRDIRSDPRPLIIHVAAVDLTAPGISFLVTPGAGSDGFDYTARTTTQFVEESGVQLAINGDFFNFPSGEALDGVDDADYQAGTPLITRGLAASRGALVTDGYLAPGAYTTLYLSADNRAAFNVPPGTLYNAISGHILLQDGEYRPLRSRTGYVRDPQPRSAAALTRDGGTLLLIVVDGRQPNYSEGVSLAELAALVLEFGGWDALVFDGGGSSALVTAGADGTAQALNSPIHFGIPGTQRPVANHLGVFARAVGG